MTSHDPEWQATHSYVGVCPKCGNVHGMIVDMPDEREAVATFVAEMIANGLQVLRVPIEDAREMSFGVCTANRETPLPGVK